MVTLPRFRNTFPEFRKTEDHEIEAKIAIAKLRVNAGVWGDKADAGVLYLSAHMVALAPAGQNAKLKPENAAKTVYLQEYRAIMRSVTFGHRIAGAAPPSAFRDPRLR